MKPTGHARQTIAFSAPLMKTPRLLFLWQELNDKGHPRWMPYIIDSIEAGGGN